MVDKAKDFVRNVTLPTKDLKMSERMAIYRHEAQGHPDRVVGQQLRLAAERRKMNQPGA